VKYLIVLALSISAFAKDPVLLDWHVNVDSFMVLSKSVSVDTLRSADTVHTAVLDTITSIAWAGSVVYSCLDSSGDSMGVFINVNIGSDTLQADSVWGVTTAHSGTNLETFFSFHTAYSHWSGEMPARVQLSLDNVLLGYTGRPRIVTQPANVSTIMGNQATFSVGATGDPAPTYTWRFNGTPIAGANKADLVFPSVDSSQTGAYSVVVANGIGSVVSQTATLFVNYAPIITAQPAPETVAVGRPALFSVTQRSYPASTFQWKKDGVIVAGAVGASYAIASVAAADSGAYSVVVSNIIGNTASSSAVLTVNYAPVILAQPQSQRVRPGQSAYVRVLASGRPAPSYQWKRNGSAVTGGSYSAYGFLSFGATDTGAYVAVITNSIGSVTSDTARIAFDNTALATDSMITIAGGTFLMGKLGLADPVHTVTLSTFRMGNTFVTQREYVRVMGINPSHFAGDSTLPVENVTWFDAALYCNKRSVMEHKDTVYYFSAISGTPGNGATALADLVIDQTKTGYRLPTEAEFEYACRAGTSTDYYWGGSYPPLTYEDTLAVDCNAVWFHNSNGQTRPVGCKQPNLWGLYDIVGNLWQWHDDWDGPYTSDPQTDPLGPDTGFSRNVRGGSWSSEDDDRHLRSMARNGGYFPNDRSSIIGFRIVIK
jgi:formylglycine-generating enzyme required for sulfatase activity